MPEEDKIHPPTPRRRRRAKSRGHVVKSIEVNSAVMLAGSVLLFRFFGWSLLVRLFSIFQKFLNEFYLFAQNPWDACLIFRKTLLHTGILLLPLFLFFLVVGFVSNIAQVGFVFSFYPLVPDFDRINPVKGLKRLFSKQALVRLFISILKISFIGTFAYLVLKRELPFIFSLTGQQIPRIFLATFNLLLELLLYLCLAVVPLAFLDYLFQKRGYERELRMTREELKEEIRQTEGDPLIKSRIRRLQRQMLRSRMMQKVPQADVVITNPSHIAVALQYEREKMNAPVVVAKGRGFIAEKIKEIARRHNVPIVENRWLAQMLYKSVEIGEEIPVKFYKAVAEVLAYIYRLKDKRL